MVVQVKHVNLTLILQQTLRVMTGLAKDCTILFQPQQRALFSLAQVKLCNLKVQTVWGCNIRKLRAMQLLQASSFFLVLFLSINNKDKQHKVLMLRMVEMQAMQFKRNKIKLRLEKTQERRKIYHLVNLLGSDINPREMFQPLSIIRLLLQIVRGRLV